MPIFEYACEKCEVEFELLVRGEEVPACPGCGSEKLAKQLSVPAAHGGGGELPMMPGPCGGGGCGRMECE